MVTRQERTGMTGAYHVSLFLRHGMQMPFSPRKLTAQAAESRPAAAIFFSALSKILR
jgi:hypothetical protein